MQFAGCHSNSTPPEDPASLRRSGRGRCTTESHGSTKYRHKYRQCELATAHSRKGLLTSKLKHLSP